MREAVRLHQIVTRAFDDERNPDLGIDLAQRQRNRAEAIDVSQTDAVRRLEQHDWSLTQRCLLALLVHVSPIGIIGEEQLIILQTACNRARIGSDVAPPPSLVAHGPLPAGGARASNRTPSLSGWRKDTGASNSPL